MSGRYEIRVARPEDASALASIDASVNFSPRSEAQFAQACGASGSNREAVLLAERGEQIGGYIVFSQVLDETSIHSIAVTPQCQRQGLGQMLLDAALTRMLTAGVSRCLLEVRRSNAAARAFYERNGFVLDGTRKNYYPTPSGREDALLMSKAVEG